MSFKAAVIASAAAFCLAGEGTQGVKINMVRQGAKRLGGLALRGGVGAVVIGKAYEDGRVNRYDEQRTAALEMAAAAKTRATDMKNYVVGGVAARQAEAKEAYDSASDEWMRAKGKAILLKETAGNKANAAAMEFDKYVHSDAWLHKPRDDLGDLSPLQIEELQPAGRAIVSGSVAAALAGRDAAVQGVAFAKEAKKTVVAAADAVDRHRKDAQTTWSRRLEGAGNLAYAASNLVRPSDNNAGIVLTEMNHTPQSSIVQEVAQKDPNGPRSWTYVPWRRV